MALTLVDVNFSFLTSGPAFRVSLPTDFNALPELSSPVFNGVGARSFVYYPTPFAPNPVDAGQLLVTLTGGDGRTVELFLRLEPPPVWWLWWSLSSGGIGTHLREEDGVDRADSVAAAVSIIEGTIETPFVLLGPPLASAVSADPGYQETATYVATQRGWSVKLQRPGFLSSGKIRLLPRTDVTILRAGVPDGMEVEVVAETNLEDAEQLMGIVRTSLSEA